MSLQSYLIDTNILIGLEDNRAVGPAYARFYRLAVKHKADVFVHEVAKEDISQDTDTVRRETSLSKTEKYQIIKKTRGLEKKDLEDAFGPLKNQNDFLDANLLHALSIGAVNFLVTEDKGIHRRASRHCPRIADRILYIGDAADILESYYEPTKVPIRNLEEMKAHEIGNDSEFFCSLRSDYPDFDDWWQKKCIGERRDCWVVWDGDRLAGLIVRKDETSADTDAVTLASKILKVCTFKVRPENRGMKLGELLLKQVLWYAQVNDYGLVYLTTQRTQIDLINLLEYFGFLCKGRHQRDELIYEREFSSSRLALPARQSVFEAARRNHPRFVVDNVTCGFIVPIREGYHDILYPDLLENGSGAQGPARPGNAIRKVYVCRSPSNLASPGSVLFFYKGKSGALSQVVTAIGVLEDVTYAKSTKELIQKTGGRSAYSKADLAKWKASRKRPVKVINFLHVGYMKSPLHLGELQSLGAIKGPPPQSICRLEGGVLMKMLKRAGLPFEV